MQKKFWAAIALAAAGGFGAQAEDRMPAYALPEVVVTATTTPVPFTKSNASMTVITKEEIEAKHYNTLQDALINVPGYNGIVTQNGVGFEASSYTRPAIRGTNNIVVMVDGIEQKTYDRFYSTAIARNLADVEKIEILKTSASTLYGANAVGGVINIITRKSYEKAENRLTVMGGSYETYQYKLDSAGEEGDFFWAVSGTKRDQGDYTDGRGRTRPQDVDVKSLDTKFGFHLTDTTDFIVKYARHNQHNNHYTEGFVNHDADSAGTFSLTNLSLILDYKSKDGKQGNLLGYWHSKLKSDKYEDHLPTTNTKKYPSGFYKWTEKFENETWSVTDRYYRQLSDNNRISAGFLVEENTKGSASLRNEAVYVQDEWSVTDKLKLTGGVRYAHSPKFSGKWLYGANLGYDIMDKIHAYVASNQFMILPTPSQIYGSKSGSNTYLPNYGLKPITGTSNEFGMNFLINDKTYFDFNVFKRKQKDTIKGENVVPGERIYRYYNEDYNKSIKGAEINFFKGIGKYVTARLGYAHLSSDTESALEKYAKDQFKVGISYRRPSYNINIEGVGLYDIVPPSKFVTNHVKYLPEQTYWVWNLSANCRVSKNTNVFLQLNNIFDLYYMSLSDYDSVENCMRYHSAPGRNFMLGVEYEF